MSLIPKKMHFIWVGDESLRPDAYIDTWRQQHPDFEICIWGNKEWKERDWINRQQMEKISTLDRGMAGVADMMRWEILLKEGGFALDADSVCLQRLPDWIFDCSMFAVWENEYSRPGLVANGYVGSVAGHEIIEKVVRNLHQITDIRRRFVWKKLRFKNRKVWETSGPVPFTKAIFEEKNATITILPSHFFLPIHHTGKVFTGQGPVYSCEFFAGTKSSYNQMKGGNPEQLVEATREELSTLIEQARNNSSNTD